ncbi:alpha/beta hydrolase [Alteromonas lipotrueiana]|uniref:alpha/beta hydrolase n=1 Tax=Alteromonas lipotrueiana TaxID=2803815 RepID=UPI001FE91A33|nr:alpha/beta hydrolase-fold protein [Alteromonas lipotrueiana]
MKTYYLLLSVFFCFTVNAQAHNVSVTVPQSYETETSKKYPVIYLLDGTPNKNMLSGMLQRLHLSKGSYEHIIVSIDVEDRLNDFAPTVNMDPRGPVGKGGGGDKFLDFLEQELMPSINKKYRASKFNTIAGHSVAGLLVIHSFHSRPKLFQSHLAFSPAVWWGARETVKSAKNYVLSNGGSENYLYMNIGSESGEMKRVYDSFAKTILKNRSIDLKLKLNEFKDVSHDFTMAAGLYNALSGLHQYQRSKDI